MGRHRRSTEPRYCKYCGEEYARKYLPCGKLERYQDFITRSYCSRGCVVNAIALARQQIRERVREESARAHAPGGPGDPAHDAGLRVGMVNPSTM